MKYGYTLCFRPFGYCTRAFFVKTFVFNTNKERMDFVYKVPRYKKRYPFSYGFYVIPEEGDLYNEFRA